MKTFSIDGKLEEMLLELQEKFGYESVGETMRKSFLMMNLLNAIEEDGSQIFYQDKNKKIIAINVHDKKKVNPLIITQEMINNLGGSQKEETSKGKILR